MSPDPALGALLVVVVAVALLFAVVNGLHDASVVIATPVASGAMAPGAAVLLAAALNLFGGLLGSRLAEAIGYVLVSPVLGSAGLVLVLAALVGALTWNLLTWWRGVPSSSTHALVGGLAGAGLVVGAAVDWPVVLVRVLLPLVVSPVVAFVVSAGIALAIAWALRHAAPGRANRGFRYAQVFSSAGVALGHGLQDAQKTMGVVVLAMVAAGATTAGGGVPLWVVVSASVALALGTTAGGWRIVRTVGSRITAVDPAAGFSAEAATAGLLTAAAAGAAVPVSTTHAVTAAVAGSGVVRRLSAVRWRVLRRVSWFWVLTAPASAVVAAAAALLLTALV